MEGRDSKGVWNQHVHTAKFKMDNQHQSVSSVAQSCPALCDPMDCSTDHGLQSPCPSPTPAVYSNSCPLSRWCHPTISSSATYFSSCSPSFPAWRSLPVSLLFASGGQSIGAFASASVLPMNIQGWFPLGLMGLISFLSKGLSRVFSSTTILILILKHSTFFMVHLSHLYMTIGKTMCESHSAVPDILRPHGLSKEFSRWEYWSGLSFPSPGIKPGSLALQANSLPSELSGNL